MDNTEITRQYYNSLMLRDLSLRNLIALYVNREFMDTHSSFCKVDK